MKETIYREAAIKEIYKFDNYLDDDMIWRLHYALRKIPAADVQPRWIPVSERLPDKIEDVLIYGEWTGVSGTKYREIWLTDLESLLHQGYKPIAWMPLPEPPKEE